MVQGCGASANKFLIVTVNLIVFVAGVAIAGVTGAALANDTIRDWMGDEIEGMDKTFSKDLADAMDINAVLIAGIIVGCFIAFCGFLGCCGGWTENSCLLSLYVILMALLSIGTLAIGIVVFTRKDLVNDGIDKAFEQMRDRVNGTNDACKSFKDFARDKSKVPCCGYNKTDIASGTINGCNLECTAKAKKQTCPVAIQDLFWDNSKKAGIGMIIVLVIEVLATLLGGCLCSSVCKQRGYNRYA